MERVLYLTAAMTGLRQGELIGLRWRDVDWSAGVIRMRRAYVGVRVHDGGTTGGGSVRGVADLGPMDVPRWGFGIPDQGTRVLTLC
jgi:integrase